MRINNTSVCWNKVTQESIIHQYAGMRYHENQQFISMLWWGHLRINKTLVCWDEVTWELTHSSILMCYWFSGDLFLSYWCVIDSQVTSFQHTDVLLILMLPHSSILMCYWFSCDLIPAYWCVIDSQVTSFQHTDVFLILRWRHSSTWESITHQYAGMR
jgi:hypothetical protein